MTERSDQPRNGLYQLIADIYAADPDPLSCQVAHRLVGLVVDNQFDDDTAKLQYPDLFRHLDACTDCADRYHMVTEYARLEADGALPNPSSIPALPAELHQAKGGWMERLVRLLFPGFPAATPAMALRGSMGLSPVSIALDDLGIVVEIQVQSSSISDDLRSLHCSFSWTERAEHIENSIVEALLEWEETGEEEQALTGNLATGVTFLDIEPALYRLLLTIDDQNYVIESIEIP
ncbi:MAG: hypothetical protein BroJett021_15820 [Chloroflexota bacterium]|jgi:hypothetical protein|nr:hypothetical protein [Caldilinea sp.]GIK72594.1 MAG: hypothetical protein BroJett021_15820 [Chloroflexota bacterium]